DLASLKKLQGVFDRMEMDSFEEVRKIRKDSLVAPVKRPVDWTDKGSEKRTDSENKIVKNPKAPRVIADSDAFSDRKIFYIPSERLFWGGGSSMKPSGKKQLEILAAFMKRLPCQTTIGELAPGKSPQDSPSPQKSLERAWAVANYLTEKQGLPKSRFSIAVPNLGPAEQPYRQRMIQIALILRTMD
ncbi:unnamed protein product, partial [marine sediment metagenome]